MQYTETSRSIMVYTCILYICIYCIVCGPGSSVGIATDYVLDGPGSKIPVGTRFFARPDRPQGPHSLLYNGYQIFLGGKVRPGYAADHSPLLVLRSWKSIAIPLPTLWACNGITLPFYLLRMWSAFGWRVLRGVWYRRLQGTSKYPARIPERVININGTT